MTLTELIDRLERITKDKPLQDELHDILAELAELKLRLGNTIDDLPVTATRDRLMRML